MLATELLPSVTLQLATSLNGRANPISTMSGFDRWVVPTSTTATSGLRGFGSMGNINGRWHMGSDFYGSNRHDVVAVADGLVMRDRLAVFRPPTENRPTIYSQAVIIRHDGPFVVRGVELEYIYSVYQVYGPHGGYRDVFVQPGDTVRAGQPIARNGPSYPLHFEVRRPSDNTPDDIFNHPRAIDEDYHINPQWIFTDHTSTAFNRR